MFACDTFSLLIWLWYWRSVGIARGNERGDGFFCTWRHEVGFKLACGLVVCTRSYLSWRYDRLRKALEGVGDGDARGMAQGIVYCFTTVALPCQLSLLCRGHGDGGRSTILMKR